MTRDETIAFFKQRDEFWRQRDAVRLAAGHSERGTIISPMFATVQGRDAIEKSYRDLFKVFTDLDIIIEDVIVDGDHIALAFRASATHSHEFFGLPGTGRRFDIHGVFLHRLEGGLIAHERRVYDFTGLLIQVGVLKARPGS